MKDSGPPRTVPNTEREMDAAERSTPHGVVTDLAGLHALAGTDLGHTEWREMTQDRVDAFAEVTEDHNFIHVDPARARETPFGGTIAHGYLTVSLLPVLSMEIFRIQGLTMGINYGLDRVRFPSPVLTGSSIRAEATLTDVRQTHLGSLASIRMRIEIEGQDKAACVADTLSLFVA
jgi:acyl dehydratase